MLQALSLQPTAQHDFRQFLEELYQGRSLQAFRAGHAIALPPQTIWVVVRGVVQLSTLYPNGDEALIGLACGAMPFGLPLSLIQPYQAIALSDVDLMQFSWGEVQQSAVLSQQMFHQLARRLRQTEAMLAMAGYRRVEDRLRQFLLLLQMEVGQPVADGTRLSVRLTHQHLASAIGTTRVTVTRLLGKLRDEGWLRWEDDRHLVVLHEQAGRKVCG